MNELKNIYEIYKSYKQNSLKGINKNIPLFYFQNSFALCQSELESLKTIYLIDNIKLTDENCISLEEVFNDTKLKEELFYRIKENIFIYDEDEINIKDYTLIWNISGFDRVFLIKQDNKIILPRDKINMPFHFNGGINVMIENGKFGVIKSETYYEKIDYKIILPFEYYFIREDGFGNLEILKEKPTKTDKITCEMINKNGKKIQNVLFESTNSNEYITIEKNLFIQHTTNGISKPYKDIKNNFLNIKAVQCENNLWGFIDKNGKEIIPCKYKNYGNFYDGYCIIKEDNYFVIDEKDNLIIKDMDLIIDKNPYFLVKKNSKWAMYKNDKLIVEFMDIDKKLQEIKIKNNLSDKEIEEFLQKKYWKITDDIRMLDKIEILLRLEYYKQNLSLKKQKYRLPLKEYVKLFDTFKDMNDLVIAGLWGVKVKKKNGEIGTIRWHYPANASLYDMSVELPVDNFGVKIEELELLGDEK